MTILETSQIIFNIVLSLAAIIIAVFFSILAYDAIKFSRAAKKFFDDIGKESTEIYEKINKFLESVFALSFLSKFFKKKKVK